MSHSPTISPTIHSFTLSVGPISAHLMDGRCILVVTSFTEMGALYRWRYDEKIPLRGQHVSTTRKYCEGWVIPIGVEYDT